MAMIKCKECGHDVSDKASVCPNCGCPIEKGTNHVSNKPVKNKTKSWFLLALLLCLIIGGGYYAFNNLFNGGKDAIVEFTPKFVNAIQQYEKLGSFSEGYAAVCKNEKWGYINTKGDEVIPVSIEAKCVGRFSEGLAVVMCGGEDFKIINTAGESLFSLKIINRGYDMNLHESSELPYYINGKLYVPLYDENGNIGFSIYDKNGNEVGKAEEKDGFEFYKQNEAGDYITFFKEGDSGTQLWGLKDANGNVIIEPQYDAILTLFHRWYGDNNIKTKISNGVALVVMNEVNWDSMGSGGVNHYGYVDLKGNETLSEATKAACKTSRKIINEVTDEYFDEDEGEITEDYNSSISSTSSNSNSPSWIQGTWTCDMNSPVGTIASYKIVIEGSSMTFYRNGKQMWSERFTYNNGTLIGSSHELRTNEDSHRIIDDNGNRYDASGSSSPFQFKTGHDVIGYLSGKTYRSNGNSLQIRQDGCYMNGMCVSGAPVVVDYSTYSATVRASLIPSGTITLYINSKDGTMTNSLGESWH